MAVSIKAPDAGVYGAFSPVYAQMLGRKSGNAGADVLNQLAMQILAQGEQSGYADLLKNTNMRAVEGAGVESRGAVAKAMAEKYVDAAKAGVGQSYMDTFSPMAGIDPMAPGPALRQSDNVYLDNAVASGQKDRAAVVKDMSAADLGLAPEDAGVYLGGTGGPLETDRYITFGDETARKNADANMVSAMKPPSSGSGGDVKLTIEDDGFGNISRRMSGNPASVEAAYGHRDASKGSGAPKGKSAAELVSIAKGQGAKASVRGNTVTLTWPNGSVRTIIVGPDGVAQVSK